MKHTYTQHLPSRYFEPAFLRLLNWLYRYRIARQFTTTRRNVSDFCSIAEKYIYKQNISHTLTTVVPFFRRVFKGGLRVLKHPPCVLVMIFIIVFC